MNFSRFTLLAVLIPQQSSFAAKPADKSDYVATFRDVPVALPPIGQSITLPPLGSQNLATPAYAVPPVLLDDWYPVEYSPPHGYVYRHVRDGSEMVLTDSIMRPVERQTEFAGFEDEIGDFGIVYIQERPNERHPNESGHGHPNENDHNHVPEQQHPSPPPILSTVGNQPSPPSTEANQSSLPAADFAEAKKDEETFAIRPPILEVQAGHKEQIAVPGVSLDNRKAWDFRLTGLFDPKAARIIEWGCADDKRRIFHPMCIAETMWNFLTKGEQEGGTVELLDASNPATHHTLLETAIGLFRTIVNPSSQLIVQPAPAYPRPFFDLYPQTHAQQPYQVTYPYSNLYPYQDAVEVPIISGGTPDNLPVGPNVIPVTRNPSTTHIIPPRGGIDNSVRSIDMRADVSQPVLISIGSGNSGSSTMHLQEGKEESRTVEHGKGGGTVVVPVMPVPVRRPWPIYGALADAKTESLLAVLVRGRSEFQGFIRLPVSTAKKLIAQIDQGIAELQSAAAHQEVLALDKTIYGVEHKLIAPLRWLRAEILAKSVPDSDLATQVMKSSLEGAETLVRTIVDTLCKMPQSLDILKAEVEKQRLPIWTPFPGSVAAPLPIGIPTTGGFPGKSALPVGGGATTFVPPPREKVAYANFGSSISFIIRDTTGGLISLVPAQIRNIFSPLITGLAGAEETNVDGNNNDIIEGFADGFTTLLENSFNFPRLIESPINTLLGIVQEFLRF